MERRKILLGSGAALATVLAGCSSSETGDDDPEDDTEESFGDDTDDSGTDDHDENDADEDDDHDDVPGFDDDELEDFESDKLTIMDIERDGDKIDVVARTETTDEDELRKEFEKSGEDLARAVVDPEHFKAEIDTIEWIVEYEGSRVLAVYIDVQWVLDYLEGELSDEEFADKVYETKD